MPISLTDANGDFKGELDKQAFREKFAKSPEELKQMRATKAEQGMRDKIMAERKTKLPPAFSKSEKDTERRKVEAALKKGFEDAGIKIAWTGKTGEFAVRMPNTDYTVKITTKKERQAALDG